jgi:hypothetical protein
MGGLPGIRVLGFGEDEQNNFQYVVIDVDQDLAGLDRDTLGELLTAENGHARRGHPRPAFLVRVPRAAAGPRGWILSPRDFPAPRNQCLGDSP